MGKCMQCEKEIASYLNFCSWDCQVQMAFEMGGVAHTPNGLRVSSIQANGNMFEHEHGDHPDYKFPVTVEFCGERPELPDWDHSYTSEVHALIYSDGYIAVTMYEHCYAMWQLVDGKLCGGNLWEKDKWKLAEVSVDKILSRHENGKII